MPFATSPADLPDRDTILSLSGLEFMQAVLRGDLPGAPIAQGMNFTLDSVAQGQCVFSGTPEFAHANPVGGVHGGWYGTVLDSCMACAVMTTVPKGAVYTTLEYKINIVRAIPLGTTVTATGTVDHAGRSTGVASGRIEGADGTLYATGSTTCLIMRIA
ncbi:PaaI family thioesterase [Loktanella sp. M215]|uniref:PaaI family thioesterase n=1 Tax=Loktanella sp. M215 TaxID=2675431 RepID=UPI001F3D0250|nr:PaaI family thioesterase [Loktanella sp. M215]MCF7701207.1 hotdog fold thioesterase [Loktanella sp. M215]